MFVGALVAGTGCSLTSKVLLSMEAVGSSGEIEPFSNPLFQTLGMFVGMCMALPVYWIHSAMNRRKAGYESIQDSGAAPPPAVTWSTILALAIPSLFDLAATALCMFGLGYVSVSVYQMLRGGAIVFVAILKHTYLGDKLASFSGRASRSSPSRSCSSARRPAAATTRAATRTRSSASASS